MADENLEIDSFLYENENLTDENYELPFVSPQLPTSPPGIVQAYSLLQQGLAFENPFDGMFQSVTNMASDFQSILSDMQDFSNIDPLEKLSLGEISDEIDSLLSGPMADLKNYTDLVSGIVDPLAGSGIPSFAERAAAAVNSNILGNSVAKAMGDTGSLVTSPTQNNVAGSPAPSSSESGSARAALNPCANIECMFGSVTGPTVPNELGKIGNTIQKGMSATVGGELVPNPATTTPSFPPTPSSTNPITPDGEPIPSSKEQDIDLLTRTLWGEARGETQAGKEAVASVIMNRVNQAGPGASVTGTVLSPKQFSAWNTNDPNREKMLNLSKTSPEYLQLRQIAERAVNGTLPDSTGGATFYHTTSINPGWSSSGTVTGTIGSHIFYKNIPASNRQFRGYPDKIPADILARTSGSLVPTQSFPVGTRISTKNGYINIEDIKVGDQLVGMNDHKEFVYPEVKNISSTIKRLYKVKHSRGEIITTLSQNFVLENMAWVRVELLKKNHKFYNINKELVDFMGIEDLQREEKVYDLTLSDPHTFFAEDILVHNDSVSFVNPVPSGGRLSSGFGPRKSPTAGASSDHKGIDIAAPRGTPIVSSAPGRVTRVGSQQKGYGNYVYVDHGNGVETRYAHLDTSTVQVGDRLEAGQQLGTMGSTGTSTGNHLHFEVRKNGIPVDPMTVIDKSPSNFTPIPPPPVKTPPEIKQEIEQQKIVSSTVQPALQQRETGCYENAQKALQAAQLAQISDPCMLQVYNSISTPEFRAAIQNKEPPQTPEVPPPELPPDETFKQPSKNFSLEDLMPGMPPDIKPPVEVFSNLRRMAENILEPLVDQFGREGINILNGWRDPSIDAELSEQSDLVSESSDHNSGNAVDLNIAGLDQGEVASWIYNNLPVDKLVLYDWHPNSTDASNTWMHVSYLGNVSNKFIGRKGGSGIVPGFF